MNTQTHIELQTADGRKVRAIQCVRGQQIGFGRTEIAKAQMVAFLEDGKTEATVVLKCATVANVSGQCEFRPTPDGLLRIPAGESCRLASWAAARLHPAT